MTGSRSDPAALARHLVPPSPRPEGDADARAAAAGRPYGADSCGDFDIRIARDGTWFYHGSPITRKPLVKLFASVLRRDEVGDYWLQTPAEKGRIQVDDAPFVAVEVTVSGNGREQRLIFRTNLDELVAAGPEHHIRVIENDGAGAPRPYVTVRDRLDALIARPVFYQLVDLAEELPGSVPRLGVWSGGALFPLGSLV